MYRGLTLHWCHHGKQGLLGDNAKIFRVVLVMSLTKNAKISGH